MLFDSTTFLVFFSVAFAVYHALGRWFRAQNVFLLAASCVFYAWWDWRFLFLLLASAGVDFCVGFLLASPRLGPRGRKAVLATSLTVNLGILFVFKYYDFFAESAQVALASVGVQVSPPLLRVALPVGVSFYTFQSMAYGIDVYFGRVVPERNPISFFLFVSLFPHMVAGPIQRASHLLDQVNRPRAVTAENVREAVWLLAYGYFLKVTIADAAATVADLGFAEDQRSGWSSLLGVLGFSVQIYCDFNAYSLIARGTGRLLGFEFIWNFDQPYFATTIQDFWRRWHISLSTWLRDYLYISLGGNRRGPTRTYVNLLLTMLLGGLWHGAAWNFVLWGLLHGVTQAVHKAISERRGGKPLLPAALGWLGTMAIVGFGWFLFRCSSFAMISGMLRSLRDLSWTAHHTRSALLLAAALAPAAAIEIWQWRRRDLLAPLELRPVPFALLTGALTALAFASFTRNQHAFIYFQF